MYPLFANGKKDCENFSKVVAYSFNSALYWILSIHLVHNDSFFLYRPKIKNQQNWYGWFSAYISKTEKNIVDAVDTNITWARVNQN